jgi:hypothetical protein
MMRIFKGGIAGCWVARLLVVAAAASLVPTLLEHRQNALTQETAQAQYEAQLQHHYGQHAYLPAVSAVELFARMR